MLKLVKEIGPKGRKLKAHFSVATMGCSSLTYIEAFPDEKTQSVVAGINHAFEYMGLCRRRFGRTI